MDTFTVLLDHLPLADVQIAPTSGEMGEVLVSPSLLTFTPANWSTAQTVTLTGVDDWLADGPQTTRVTVSVVDAGSDDAWDPLPDKSITVTTIDNEDTATLVVTEFTATATGFTARFGRDLDPSVLNLYDSASQTLGPADATVTGAAVGDVRGSLVVGADRRQITFVQTGGLLEPDTYTVTLFSGATRFREPTGGALDGNADGTTGDDYQTTFTVPVRPAGTVTISLPDFARGAGQGVNIPAAAIGLPIHLDNAAGVTSLAVDLVYDQALLAITAATLAAGLPADWTVVNPPDTSTPGVAKIRASGTTLLSGNDVDVVRLTAAVPSGAHYGAVQAIRLENIALNGGAIAAVGDVAVHKAAYLGDTDGSGIHSSADAFLTVQAALGLASGFAAHAWTDPLIVGEADGSGVLSAADAFLIVQEGLGLSEPFVPDNPHITVTPVGGGVDPKFQIDVNLPASVGGQVTVPVRLVIEPAATNVSAIEFDLFFDPAQLTIQLPEGVSAGADTAGWSVSAILVAPGRLRVGMVSSNGQPLTSGLREIARLPFRVDTGVYVTASLRDAIPVSERPDYVAALDVEPADLHAGGYSWTASDGSILIGPASPALVWHKVANPVDVNGDGFATPADVLILVNYINSRSVEPALPSAGSTPCRYDDVNNDQACTALDALALINHLNARSLPAVDGRESSPHNSRHRLLCDLETGLSALDGVLDDVAEDIASAWS